MSESEEDDEAEEISSDEEVRQLDVPYLLTLDCE